MWRRGEGLRLSSALRAVGAFSGPLPPPAPRGRFERPWVPDDVAHALGEVPPLRRRALLDPLDRSRGTGTVGRPRRLALPSLTGVTAPARQVDGTTCGSAVLALLALAGDPRAALRAATGDAAENFATLQRSVKRATNRGPVRWPDRYGTPPWGAATVARYGPVRYTHRVVGRPGRDAGTLLAAVDAARAGIPVPLFTGGDVGGGLAAAVPRHVVLLTTADGEGRGGDAVVYEPGSAALHTVPVAALLDPARADPASPAARALRAALGGWPHVTWALLPAGLAQEQVASRPGPRHHGAMSTLPGDDTFRDAGVERPGESGTPLEELVTEGNQPDAPEHEPDEYRPAAGRPDREGRANEADVVEQAIEVPHEEEGRDVPEP